MLWAVKDRFLLLPVDVSLSTLLDVMMGTHDSVDWNSLACSHIGALLLHHTLVVVYTLAVQS